MINSKKDSASDFIVRLARMSKLKLPFLHSNIKDFFSNYTVLNYVNSRCGSHHPEGRHSKRPLNSFRRTRTTRILIISRHLIYYRLISGALLHIRRIDMSPSVQRLIFSSLFAARGHDYRVFFSQPPVHGFFINKSPVLHEN